MPFVKNQAPARLPKPMRVFAGVSRKLAVPSTKVANMKHTIAPIGALLALIACSGPMSTPVSSRPSLMAQSGSGIGKVRIQPNHITFASVYSGPRKVRISQRGYAYGPFSYVVVGNSCRANASAGFQGYNQRGETLWSIYPTAQVAHGCPLEFFGAGNRKARLFVSVK